MISGLVGEEQAEPRVCCLSYEQLNLSTYLFFRNSQSCITTRFTYFYTLHINSMVMGNLHIKGTCHVKTCSAQQVAEIKIKT